MLFDYKCEACEQMFEMDFRIGQAEPEVDCECGGKAKKAFTKMNFQLKGGDWPSRSGRLKSEMTARNEAAGKRMRKEHKPGMKTIAYDYGNGDIREVKKK